MLINDTEERIERFLGEILEFHEFLNIMAQEIHNEFSMVNRFDLALKVDTFFEKNHAKYNDTQMVYQFLLQLYKNDKDIMKMYRAFKK